MINLIKIIEDEARMTPRQRAREDRKYLKRYAMEAHSMRKLTDREAAARFLNQASRIRRAYAKRANERFLDASHSAKYECKSMLEWARYHRGLDRVHNRNTLCSEPRHWRFGPECGKPATFPSDSRK